MAALLSRTTAARAVATVVLAASLPSTAAAQERLVGSRSIAVGASFDRISFTGDGLSQSGFAGLDTTRVNSTDQFTLPVAASSPLAGNWRLDLTTLYGSGRVQFNDPTAAGGSQTATLSGLSDVRLRATGPLLRDNVVLTVGLNLPSGRTALNNAQFGTLRILSAPALGLGSSPVGAGMSGTVGLVFAQQVGEWAVAYGTSYEVRGRYQPVAALIAGSGSADYLPGGVFRASLGADRLVGNHRLSLAAAADVFADDRLRGAAFGDTALSGVTGESKVRLGPVLSGDVQLLIASSRFRELLAYSAFRWRAPFARDGRTVERSSGQYLEAGLRAVLPWGLGRDLVLSSDARLHSGLGVDQGLPTAGVVGGSLTAGLQLTRGLRSLQPFVRMQGGSLRQRAALVPTATQGFFGFGSGIVFVSRF